MPDVTTPNPQQQPEALPEPLPLNIQGLLVPSGDGKAYVVLRFTDPTSSVGTDIRMTGERSLELAPKLAEILVQLGEKAVQVSGGSNGLAVARRAGIVLPGQPGFAPPANGKRV